MPTWSGWETQLLNEAGLSTAKMTVQFMDDWNFAASSSCANNPVDISRKETGSSDCHKLTSTRTAQAYTSHTFAAAGFSGQVTSGNFPHLLAALKTSNPYTYSDPAGVVSDLNTWGSPKQATYYQNNATGGSGGSGTSSADAHAPHAHRGWRYLVKSVGNPMTSTLQSSNRSVRHARQSLARARRIK